MRRTLLLTSALLAACNPVLTPVVERKPQSLTSVESHPPRVVWVIDKSGSMAEPMPASCTTSCATRLQALQGWVEAVAMQLAPARHAAVFYPSDNVCGRPNSFEVPMQQTATAQGFDAVLVRYQNAMPGGGTPTAAALDFAGTVPDEPDVDTYVVLVTDGQPNCNPSNTNTCADPTACKCTLTTCGNPGSAFCTLDCSDDLGSIEASRRLAQKGWSLMVVGVGEDTASAPVSGVMSGLDIGLPRTCTTSSDCIFGACTNGVCADKYYQVSTPADFQPATNRITGAVQDSARCTWWLKPDVVAGDLTVSVDGAEVPATDWTLTKSRRLHFSGDTCKTLLGSQTLAPTVVWRPGSGG